MESAATRAVRNKGRRTRETILDAAEELFGGKTFDSVSMREVAVSAEVLLGVLSYHFKSKEALFEAVAARRADHANAVRLETLRQFESPDVEQILDAFIRPILTLYQEPQWQSYLNIVRQITQEPRWAEVNRHLFKDCVDEFYRALTDCLPDVPKAVLARGFLYVVFLLLGSIRAIGNSAPETPAAAVGEVQPSIETIISFAAAGLRQLARDSQG